MKKQPWIAQGDLEGALRDYYREVGDLASDRPLPRDGEVFERAPASGPFFSIVQVAAVLAVCAALLGVFVWPRVVAPSGAMPGANSSAADTSTWTRLAPGGAGFSVLMPGTAPEQVGVGSSLVVNANQTEWAYTDGSSVTFKVLLLKFQAGALTGVSLDTLMNGEIAAMPGATLTSQSDATLDGHSGRFFTAASSTGSFTAEFFVAGDDVYGIGVGGDTGKADAARTQAFFASFRITV